MITSIHDSDVCSIASAMLKAVSIYKNGLKIIHINGESLLKKIDELRSVLLILMTVSHYHQIISLM